jgi:hypothetical protein
MSAIHHLTMLSIHFALVSRPCQASRILLFEVRHEMTSRWTLISHRKNLQVGVKGARKTPSYTNICSSFLIESKCQIAEVVNRLGYTRVMLSLWIRRYFYTNTKTDNIYIRTQSLGYSRYYSRYITRYIRCTSRVHQCICCLAALCDADACKQDITIGCCTWKNDALDQGIQGTNEKFDWNYESFNLWNMKSFINRLRILYVRNFNTYVKSNIAYNFIVLARNSFLIFYISQRF